MELLTVSELATLLKMSKRQIYGMTEMRTRTGAMRDAPLPMVKINGNIRFIREDVQAWLERLAARGR